MPYGRRSAEIRNSKCHINEVWLKSAIPNGRQEAV
jgi:hypothetical protein